MIWSLPKVPIFDDMLPRSGSKIHYIPLTFVPELLPNLHMIKKHDGRTHVILWLEIGSKNQLSLKQTFNHILYTLYNGNKTTFKGPQRLLPLCNIPDLNYVELIAFSVYLAEASA